MHKAVKIQAGFTLVEILVAVSIFGLAFTGIAAVVNTVVNSAALIQNNYIASGLAQEAIELTRNLRDNDWHAGLAWGSSLPDGTRSLQYNSLSLGGNQANYLKKDANGLYQYDSGTDTGFKRSVLISTPTDQGGKEKKLEVTITWMERRVAKTLTVEDHLFNWNQ